MKGLAEDGINIKESHKGRFTKYCKDKGHDSVTQECIDEGLASSKSSVRKQAQFAANARKWKH